MAVGVLNEVTEMTTEMYDQVDAKLNTAGDPPDGLIIHTAGATGGGLRIFDVWESEEQYNRFREERLLPAIREAAGEEAVSGAPSSQIYELHNLVKP